MINAEDFIASRAGTLKADDAIALAGAYRNETGIRRYLEHYTLDMAGDIAVAIHRIPAGIHMRRVGTAVKTRSDTWLVVTHTDGDVPFVTKSAALALAEYQSRIEDCDLASYDHDDSEDTDYVFDGTYTE